MAKNDNLIDLLINDPLYTISSDGTIWACKPKSGPIGMNKIYPPRRVDFIQSDCGYMIVNYKGKRLPTHRIVYQKFYGSLDPLLEINHIDGNKVNNNPLNLEQVTSSQNSVHSLVFGLSKSGVQMSNAKLTKDQVEQMRDLYNSGKSLYYIGKQYNIGRQHVKDIVTGIMWKDYE